jgi:hypothetical protein
MIAVKLIVYKCRTSSTELEFFKTDTSWVRTFVLQLTILCFTTAPLRQAEIIDVKKEGLYSLHSTQHSYTIFLVEVRTSCLYRTMYVFKCYCIEEDT